MAVADLGAAIRRQLWRQDLDLARVAATHIVASRREGRERRDRCRRCPPSCAPAAPRAAQRERRASSDGVRRLRNRRPPTVTRAVAAARVPRWPHAERPPIRGVRARRPGGPTAECQQRERRGHHEPRSHLIPTERCCRRAPQCVSNSSRSRRNAVVLAVIARALVVLAGECLDRINGIPERRQQILGHAVARAAQHAHATIARRGGVVREPGAQENA